MIISQKHKFIFIHCRKAAGSSVVSSLSRYLGDDDLQFSAIKDGIKLKIYPPKRVVKEALRHISMSDFFSVLILKKSFWNTISNSVKKKYSSVLGLSPAHAPASVIATTFPDEWRDYFKFCVVRNPWDKTLSDYFWRTKRIEMPPDFDAYVDALAREPLPGITPKNHQNWDMYTINDELAVDYVVRFEDLTNDLSEALAKTSLEWDGWMPHMKKGADDEKGTPRRNYREYYSEHARQVVGRVYEKEINQFGYTF